MNEHNISEEDLAKFSKEDREAIENWKPKWWAMFVIIPFATAHFLLCTVLTLLVYPQSLRKKIYEYYAPFGGYWGKK